MYLGRFIVVAPRWAGYRVSSRSFPEREIVDREGTLTVVQTDAAQPTDNPYISYNCVRPTDDGAVVGNGSHVDPIAEKVDLGYPPRDALTLGLLALDYEKDDYDTPRIAGVVGDGAHVGTVRADGLAVERVAGPTLVATYERDRPGPIDLEGDDPVELARALFDLDFDHPVCAAAFRLGEGGLETAIYNGPEDKP